MLSNLIGKKIGTIYTGKLVMFEEDNFQEYDFRSTKGREKETIENLKYEIPDFNNVFAITFTEEVVKQYKKGIKKTVESTKTFYVGERITLTELNEIRSLEQKGYATMFNYDEYEVGGVFHPASKKVTPVSSVDQIIELKGKTKTIKR